LVCSVNSHLQTPKDRRQVESKKRLELSTEASTFFMGSCFGEEMHLRLIEKQHTSISNPFGVIFHPFPLWRNWQLIANSNNRTTFDAAFHRENTYQHQGVFHSLFHANRFQHTNEPSLINQVFEAANRAHEQATKADLFCVTLGTAWIYQHIPTQQFVGNCHKLPQQDFLKLISKQSDIKAHIQGIITTIKQINPNAHIVFTVSPVKHLRDGILENLRSKSTLISALHEVLESAAPNVHYFPAYEIVREELNDWKYYKEDHMHPTADAIDHVFERFYSSFFGNNASTLGAAL
jgi:hypothetical protein